ncbi:MAG: CCA tRNA nucleotidyltransferase [bacterium]
MNNDLSKFLINKKYITAASELAAELSYEIYIVGGFVRDMIIGRNKKEIDFLVVGNGLVFAEKFAERLKVKNVSMFKNFGTAHFKYHGYDFEFVGARRESYNRGSRKPIVENGTFLDDIKRRDFTINTLALSLNKKNFGELIDVYGGQIDIEKKIIKTPLNPYVTFDDDPLRIMRAFRFAAQLDFKIEHSLLEAAEKMAPRLKIVSQERITDELFKILASPTPSIGLIYAFHTKVFKEIFPELHAMGGVEQRMEYHHKDVFFHTCMVVDNIAKNTENIWLRFAALVHDIAKPQTKKFVEGTGWTFHGHDEIGARVMKHIFRRMKLPLSKLEYIQKLVRLHLRPIALVDEEVTDSAIRRLIVSAGEDLEDLITLCRADITSKDPSKVKRYLTNYEIVMKKVFEVKEKDQLRAFQSPVDGNTIMKICNIGPSILVGKIKDAIEEAILEGKIKNEYDDAYQYLLAIKDQFLAGN